MFKNIEEELPYPLGTTALSKILLEGFFSVKIYVCEHSYPPCENGYAYVHKWEPKEVCSIYL